ncbi:MAG: PAS domain S-box protein [Deltaproteobacteria bacterium]|nr:PAS domain S-box protein [Deltaproteobacteria bacterium]
MSEINAGNNHNQFFVGNTQNLLFGLILLGLIIGSYYNYLLFHSLAEFFSIVVASGIFIVAWNTRRHLEAHYLLFLGIAYLFVAILDLFHTLSYSGMNIFSDGGKDIPTQLWIAGRFLESLSLLVSIGSIKGKLRERLIFGVYFIITALLLLSIFYWKIFPVCYEEGQGLTSFKIISEYVISFILIIAIIVIYQKNTVYKSGMLKLIIAAILFTIGSELAFTFYVDVYGFSNLTGHILKLISFYLIYKAIVVNCLQEPFDVLYNDLRQKDDFLRQTNLSLEELVEKRTAELIRSDQSLANAQEIAKVGSWHLDMKKDILTWSDETYRIFGFQIGETVSNDIFFGFVHPDDRDKVNQAFQNSLRDKTTYEITHRILLKNGSIKYVNERCRTFFDEDGKPLYSLGAVQDITQSYLAEKKLKKQQELFHSIFYHIPVMISIYDPQLNLVNVNKHFEEIIGWTNEEIKTINLMEKCYPDAEYRKMAEEYMQSATIEWREFKIATKDGGKIDSIWSNIKLSDDTRVGIGIDITERKKVEASTKAQARLLELIYLHSIDNLVLLDKDYNFIQVSKSYAKACQMDSSEFIGRNHFEIYPSDLKDEFDKAKMEKSIYRRTARPFTFPDHPEWGVTYWDLGLVPIMDHDGEIEYFIFTLRDVTEKKKAEETLRQKQAQLIQSQKMEAIGVLAGGIAHDFNNILFSLIGYLNLALDEEPPSPIDDYLNESLVASKRAKDLVSQILSFSRHQKAKLRVIRLNNVIKEIIRMMRSTLPSSIQIKHLLDDDCGMVKADPIQIHQVILNICTNAEFAMRKDGGTLMIKLTREKISLEFAKRFGLEKGDFVKLSISDTGQGIDPSIVGKIFDPFFTTKSVNEGTGLGLSVVHGIIQNHHGAISVSSEPGVGTTFDVYLPLAEPIENHKEELSAGTHHGKERILIVDDEEAIIKLLTISLEKLGYIITAKTNSLEALEVFKTKSSEFDLVIMDQTMPDMTGDKLASKFIEISPNIPIILMTGFSHILSEKKVQEIGIKKLIKKPFETDMLAEAIRAVLKWNQNL